MAQMVRLWDQPSVPQSLSAYLVCFGLVHLQVLGKDSATRMQLLDLRYAYALSNSPFCYSILICWTKLNDPHPGEAYEDALRAFMQQEQDRDVRQQFAICVLALCVEAGWVGAGMRILSGVFPDLEDGPHSDKVFVLQCLSIQARLAAENGSFETAETALRHLLSEFEQKQGRTHPDTFRSLCNLASILGREGRLVEAAELLRDGLERTVGTAPTAFHVRSLKSCLAEILTLQGKWQEAEELCRAVLDASRLKHCLGDGAMVSAINNLATLLQDRGEHDAAYNLFKSACETTHGIWGPTHPRTLRARYAWGCFFEAVRQYDDAAKILSAVLCDARATFGPEHRELLPIMNRTASVLQDLGRREEAARLYDEVIAIGSRTVGSTHGYTLSAMNNLATLKADLGDWPVAVALMERVLVARIGTLDADHPATINSRCSLSRALFQLGQRDSAEVQLIEAYHSILRNHSHGTRVSVKIIAAVASGLKHVGRTTEAADLKSRFGRVEG